MSRVVVFSGLQRRETWRFSFLQSRARWEQTIKKSTCLERVNWSLTSIRYALKNSALPFSFENIKRLVPSCNDIHILSRFMFFPSNHMIIKCFSIICAILILLLRFVTNFLFFFIGAPGLGAAGKGRAWTRTGTEKWVDSPGEAGDARCSFWPQSSYERDMAEWEPEAGLSGSKRNWMHSS